MKSKSVIYSLLLGSTAMAAAMSYTAAYAQDAAPAAEPATSDAAPADDTQVVVVTGIRNALQSAAAIKRKANTFVDSITASDVAALPDLSVAEALARVPGVTVTRFTLGGSPDFPSPEGRGNLIRGLGFVRSEFNGRDAFSANGGRSLDWSSIPPQLVGGVDVYKNTSADLVEGGIGGTINLRTLEPFDRKGYYAAVSMDLNYGDLAKKFSPSYNAVIGNRWQTDIGEFGLMASLSTSNLKSGYNGWQQPAPIPRGANTGNPTDTNESSSVTEIVPGKTVGAIEGFQLRSSDINRDRSSAYLAAQWKNDTMRLTGKYIRVENKTESLEHTLESFPDGGNNQRYSVTDATFDNSTGALNRCNVPAATSATAIPFRDVNYCETLFPVDGGYMTSGLVTNDFDGWIGAHGLGVNVLGIGKTEKTVTEDLSLNFKWRPTDRWYLELDAQKTKASATSNETWGGSQTYAQAFIVPGLDDPKVTLTVDPRTQISPSQIPDRVLISTNPNVYAYTPPKQTSTYDPNAAFWLYAGDGHHDGTGELTQFKADAQYDFAGDSWFKSVKFGVRSTERSQTDANAGVNWSAVAPAWQGKGIGLFSTEATPAYETVDFAGFYRKGVLQGPNTKFLAIRSDLLMDPVAMRDYIRNEPTFNDADGTNRTGYTPQLNEDGTARYDPALISDVTEKTNNAYIMLNFGKEFANGMSVDGNFGVRYTETTLDSNGFMAYNSIGAGNADEQTPAVDENGVVKRTPDAESHDSIQDFLPETTTYLCPALATAPITAADTANGFNEANKLSRACPSGTVGKSEVRTVSVNDSHYLPSFNLKWNLNSEMLIRFGASQNISRPNIQDMRAGQVTSAVTTRTSYPDIKECVPVAPATTCVEDPLLGIDRGAQNISLDQIRITGGNPNLKPTTANSYDLSFEWYFKGGTVSAAVFQKDLKNIIQGGSVNEGSITLDGKTVSVVYGGKVNQDSASIKGVELAYQQFYDFLPGIFSHLGVQSNFTYIDATATPPPAFIDADGNGVADDFNTIYRFGVDNLLGQSKYIFNFVGIYQDAKWEGRLAYAWRDEQLQTYRDYITGDPLFIKAYGNLDGSIKYNINRQLQVSLNASNILDTKTKAEVQVNPNGDRVDRFSFLNDRRFVLDVRWQY
ncbi:MAG: TonB-dependent receptor [Asticcacaulis sp.]